jgi:glyoxylase-like metal-dependent hydrolase (beta-lactamase superfamily II)
VIDLRRPMPFVRTCVALFLCALALSGCAGCKREPKTLDLRAEAQKPGLSLYALEYARSREVPLGKLVAGAAPEQTLDMSWYFYLVLGNGRVTLIDAGTNSLARANSRERKAWRIREAFTLDQTLARVGLEPRDVSDVLLTHHHFDHSDGVPRLSRATLHVHAREWEKLEHGRRGRDFAVFPREKRLATFEATPVQVEPGIEARVAGQHTVRHTVYVVTCRDQKRVVVGGDGAYTFANLEQGKAITVSSNAEKNVSDMRALVREFGKGRVLPGHDPLVFTRFPQPVPGVARICP